MLNNIDHGYANILFTYGKRNNCLQKYYEDSLELLKILEENNKLIEIITNANLPKQERKTIITELFANTFDQTYLYFL
jgi:F0F1-type ATP synthase delta subunit